MKNLSYSSWCHISDLNQVPLKHTHRKFTVNAYLQSTSNSEILHLNTEDYRLTLLNSVVLVRKRTIATEEPQPVREVSANFR
jgi:hypothetical protein